MDSADRRLSAGWMLSSEEYDWPTYSAQSAVRNIKMMVGLPNMLKVGISVNIAILNSAHKKGFVLVHCCLWIYLLLQQH